MRTIAALGTGAWLVCATSAAQTSIEPDLFRAGPEAYAPRYEPGQHSREHPGGHRPAALRPVLTSGIVIDDTPPRRAGQGAAPGVQAPEAARGYLTLLVQPTTAQIYIDGFFVGTIEDYRGSPGPLVEAGPHRVELRADGYETAAFDVRMGAGTVVTHRGDLVRTGTSPTPAAPTAATPAANGAVRTFYVIPRCYAGDTPPRPSMLPPGCDAANVRVVPPVVDDSNPATPRVGPLDGSPRDF